MTAMTRKIETRDLYDADGRDLWTYCEHCYEVPQTVAVELATTSARDISSVTAVAAFVVACTGCDRSTRFEMLS